MKYPPVDIIKSILENLGWEPKVLIFNSLENGKQFLDGRYQIIAPFFNALHSLDLLVEAVRERNQGVFEYLDCLCQKQCSSNCRLNGAFGNWDGSRCLLQNAQGKNDFVQQCAWDRKSVV